VPTRNSTGLATNGSAGFNFAVLDGAGGIGDIGFTGDTEAFETSAGTNAVNGDVASEAFVLEEFSHALGKREHGGGTSGDDVTFTASGAYMAIGSSSVGAASVGWLGSELRCRLQRSFSSNRGFRSGSPTGGEHEAQSHQQTK
jgi:hypothetical protein